MPSKAEIARRTARQEVLAKRIETVTAEFPTVNRHLAVQAAGEDRLWGPDGLWWKYVAKANVRPCQLSCCNPTA